MRYVTKFLLKRAEVAFMKNHIKDLTKITGIFVPRIINKQIDKIFYQGQIEGEFIIPFDTEGNIKNDYGFSGKILEASINLTKEFSIKNLTTEISHTKDEEANLFNIKIKKGSFLDFDLTDSVIDLKRKNNETEVKSLLKTKGDFDFSKIKKILPLLNYNISNVKNFNGQMDLKSNIDFKLNKRFSIKNLVYLIEGAIPYSEIHFNDKQKIKKYLPDYKNQITFSDCQLLVLYQEDNLY